MLESLPRILVVEDDPVTADMLKELLASAGYEALWAPDVIGALLALERQPVDLITLDIELGTYSGRGLLALLKADQRTSHIPVIILSSAQIDDSVRRLADRVLGKPFNIGPLLQAIGGFLSRGLMTLKTWPGSRPEDNPEWEVAREVLD